MIIAKDEKFAELIGMILGDGNLGIYPKYGKEKLKIPRCHYLRIYCNIKEKQYAKEIRLLLEFIFRKKSYLYERPSEDVLYLEISLKDLDKLLCLPIGDKIKNKVKVADWILKDRKFIISCLRGLFDTDGCCYLTGGKYKVVSFTNRNKVLLEDIFRMLGSLGFNPYRKGECYVELGRQQGVNRFFDIIKPKNKKHYRHAEVANVVTAGL